MRGDQLYVNRYYALTAYCKNALRLPPLRRSPLADLDTGGTLSNRVQRGNDLVWVKDEVKLRAHLLA